MSAGTNLTRRDFIQVVGAAGGALVLGCYVPFRDQALAAPAASPAPFAPNIWLRIDADGTVTITVARSELGQGARTAMPMLVAEDLEADWSKIRIEPAVADAKYGNMTTGGSTSVREGWEPLRRAGATARVMLVAAAAQTWNVEPSECRAERGAVVHVPSGRRLGYGPLAAAAAKLPVPENVPLKDPKDFRIIGQRIARLDTPSKVDGSAVFCNDMRLPGMRVAMVERCPVFGGKLQSYDATRTLAVPGVRRVFEIPSGVAVVADTTWAAMRGREVLEVRWDEGEAAALDSAGIRRLFEEKGRGAAKTVRREGDAARALATAAKRIEAVYELPFLAHATMEPMGCVAHVRADAAEVWAPTQAPQWAKSAVAGALELAPDKVTVHTTLTGGAFGRRAMYDFVVEAAHISKTAGAPIRLLWTREDDMRHDFYRPASLHRLAAGLDDQGKLVAWTHLVVAPSITVQVFGDQGGEEEPDAVDGAAQLPYAIPNLRVDYVMANTPVPVGWWRSVYNTQNAFVNECFLDEVAAAAGADPFELRRQLLPEGSRLRRALELAAARAGWGTPPPAGRSRGIACHGCFGSFVAEVAEISVQPPGRLRVHKVVAGVECGPVVNPDTVEAQVQGGIALGLGAALHGEITLERGRVRQSNFDDFPMLASDEMPDVEVHVVPSAEAVGGIGEPGLPPATPAVCNALFAATGKRVRLLPIREEDLRKS